MNSVIEKLKDDMARLSLEARTAIDEIRDQIEELDVQRRRVERAPLDFETIASRVDQEIEARAAEAREFFPPSDLARDDCRDISGLFNRKFMAQPFSALAVLAPDALRDLLLSNAPADGIEPVAKAVKLDDINRQLLASEIAEELACRELDQISDGHCPRRTDANPAVLLAPSSELEGNETPRSDIAQ